MSSRSIPQALLVKLETKGYTVRDPHAPLDLGSEKFVYQAVRSSDRSSFVVYHSKVRKTRAGTSWAWGFERELEVMKACQGEDFSGGHPNIIRVLAFIAPDPNKVFGPCMVVEKIEPLGYDLFQVHQQYQAAQRVMSMLQVARYTEQIIRALEFLHAEGWVHSDLKVDNVMVDKDHNVKVIDFGFARKTGEDTVPDVRAPYMPPEYKRAGPKACPANDSWFVGGLIQHFYTHNYLDPSWVDSASGKRGGVTDYMLKNNFFKDQRVGEHICLALEGLLTYDPNDRWDMKATKEWVHEVVAPSPSLSEAQNKSMMSKRLSIPAAKDLSSKNYFQKAPKLAKPMKIFGLCADSESHLMQSMIGRTIGDLDLGQKKAQTVLFIDRSQEGGAGVVAKKGGLMTCFGLLGRNKSAGRVITAPGPHTTIMSGDWIYVKVTGPTQTEEAHTSAKSDLANKVEQEARQKGIELFLEFDEFAFPDHCVGMTIGDAGLRKVFGINLACIGRYSEEGQYEPIDIRADTVIESGDNGLVCRMPDRETGSSQSIITDKDLQPLFNQSEFQKRVKNTY